MPEFDYDKWYAERGGELNKTRREKYQNDPAYRERVRAANAASRLKRKKAALAEREAAERAAKTPLPPRDWKEVEAEVLDPETGRPTMRRLFTIGALAAATRRSIQVLRLWERDGLIPGPEVRTTKGDRLYSAEQIASIVETLTKAGRLNETLRQRVDHPHVERTIRYADGTEERTVLFKVGALAWVLGRTIVTVQGMEAKGALPETPFRASTRRYRLYTLEQVEAIKREFDRYGGDLRDPSVRASFRAEVLKDWEKHGLTGAVLVDDSEVQDG